MNSFKIIGGKSLKGEVTPQGAKNEALQILCAVLLTEDEIIVENIPDIKDVNLLINLLKGIGVDVKKINDKNYPFDKQKKTLRNFTWDNVRNIYNKQLN